MGFSQQDDSEQRRREHEEVAIALATARRECWMQRAHELSSDGLCTALIMGKEVEKSDFGFGLIQLRNGMHVTIQRGCPCMHVSIIAMVLGTS